MDINNPTMSLQQSREGEQANTVATEPEDVDPNCRGTDVVPLAEDKNLEQTTAGSSITTKKRLSRRALLVLLLISMLASEFKVFLCEQRTQINSNRRSNANWRTNANRRTKNHTFCTRLQDAKFYTNLLPATVFVLYHML
jgi:hypothetical protein